MSRIRIMPTKNLDPQEYVKSLRQHLQLSVEKGIYLPSDTQHAEAFLKNPSREWLSTEDLVFLCGDLSVKESAFYMPQNHARFLTHAGRDITRAYNPMSGMELHPTQLVLDNYLYVVFSPDLERAYREYVVNTPVSRPQLLVNSGYGRREGFANRLGRTQSNLWDCVPLSIYAAANSAKSLVKVLD